MKILFMCLGTFDDLGQSSVHIDLLKRLAEGHDVWLACKHEGKPTELTEEYGVHVLRVRTGELKKTGLLRKGINMVMVEPQFRKAIRKYLKGVRFDLVLYTTPPITFASAVKYVKKRDGARTYLMLKDIFPQNAVDIGLMSTGGAGGLLYRYFRKKEKQLYALSDRIGCMSPANCEYILRENPEIDPGKVEVCPNTTIVKDMSVDAETARRIREKYGIPEGRKAFIYGGNLGKPQGIPFLIECLRECRDLEDAFFLVIGQGTEYGRLEQFMREEKPENCSLMKSLPSADYETLAAACDVGLIFLDHRFTIPNFPSRLLSCMKAKVPVLACTDPNTDIGKIITEGGFGWWCESNDAKAFRKLAETALKLPAEELAAMKEREFRFLEENYSVDAAYAKVTRK